MVSPRSSQQLTSLFGERVHRGVRTGRKRLLQLLGLLSIVKDESVEVAVASDFEFDQGRTLGSLLYTPNKL